MSSMGTIGKMMKKTRSEMIEREVDSVAEEFLRRFGLRDGDYIEFDRWNSSGSLLPTKARIVSIENCWRNANGGYTAFLQVVPLLVNGRLGNSRSLMISVNANGTGLDGCRAENRRA